MMDKDKVPFESGSRLASGHRDFFNYSFICAEFSYSKSFWVYSIWNAPTPHGFRSVAPTPWVPVAYAGVALGSLCLHSARAACARAWLALAAIQIVLLTAAPTNPLHRRRPRPRSSKAPILRSIFIGISLTQQQC